MERIKFFWKDKPYETVCIAKTKIEDEWVDSIIYASLYNNKDGEIWVKTEKDNEWEQFNEAIKQGSYSANYNPNTSVRRSGRTTKMADAYIQELFDKGIVIIRDHFNNINAHEGLFYIVINRLKTEHRSTPITTDKTKLQIKLT